MRDLRDIKRGAQAAMDGARSYDPQDCFVFDGYGNCVVVGESGTSYGVQEDENGDFIANARSDVLDLVAQVEADDVLLLAAEWAGDIEGMHKCCPWCGHAQEDGHVDDCDMKIRCDKARARQAADE